MKNVLIFLLVVVTIVSFGQTEPLNQFDKDGKKNGKWVVYLDKNWDKVKDSASSVFFRFNYFDHGTSIYPMGPCGGKNYKLVIIGDSTSKLLNGEYKWYNAKGQLSSVHVLKNGEYISCKEYYSTGQLNQHFDYTKKCKGQIHGWVVYVYDKQGKLTLGLPNCPDESGKWPPTKG